jgi:hypothetical protein
MTIMNISRGYVKNWRSIDQWQWYTAPHHAHVFQHIIRKANHKDGFWRGIPLARGQYITSQEALGEECGVSRKTIRMVVTHLSLSGEIRCERANIGANSGTIITVCNYETYQSSCEDVGQQEGQQRANRGPTEGQQRATNKNDKNNNNDNNDKKEEKTLLSEAYRLADLLESLIRERQPNLKRKGNWAKDIDLMIRTDQRQPKVIESVIQWCQADNIPRGPSGFCWANNILSGAKLREKFDTLELKSKEQESHATPHCDSSGPRFTVDSDGNPSIPISKPTRASIEETCKMYGLNFEEQWAMVEADWAKP